MIKVFSTARMSIGFCTKSQDYLVKSALKGIFRPFMHQIALGKPQKSYFLSGRKLYMGKRDNSISKDKEIEELEKVFV